MPFEPITGASQHTAFRFKLLLRRTCALAWSYAPCLKPSHCCVDYRNMTESSEQGDCITCRSCRHSMLKLAWLWPSSLQRRVCVLPFSWSAPSWGAPSRRTFMIGAMTVSIPITGSLPCSAERCRPSGTPCWPLRSWPACRSWPCQCGSWLPFLHPPDAWLHELPEP